MTWLSGQRGAEGKRKLPRANSWMSLLSCRSTMSHLQGLERKTDMEEHR